MTPFGDEPLLFLFVLTQIDCQTGSMFSLIHRDKFCSACDFRSDSCYIYEFIVKIRLPFHFRLLLGCFRSISAICYFLDQSFFSPIIFFRFQISIKVLDFGVSLQNYKINLTYRKLKQPWKTTEENMNLFSCFIFFCLHVKLFL